MTCSDTSTIYQAVPHTSVVGGMGEDVETPISTLLPPIFTNVIKDISGRCSDVERGEFLEAVAAAAVGKDLSLLHWDFLGAELRSMPVRQPKHVYNVVPQVIEGITRLAAGKTWPEAAKVAKRASKKANAAEAEYADYATKYAADVAATLCDCFGAAPSWACEGTAADPNPDDVASLIAYVATSVAKGANVIYSEATYAEALKRQRDVLLSLIESARNKVEHAEYMIETLLDQQAAIKITTRTDIIRYEELQQEINEWRSVITKSGDDIDNQGDDDELR